MAVCWDQAVFLHIHDMPEKKETGKNLTNNPYAVVQFIKSRPMTETINY